MKIKLKAWYVAGKHWFTDFSLSNDGETVYETGDRYSVADEEVILVQFTELEDKNGEEVYEGEIILNDDRNEVAIVKWDNKKAMFITEYVETKDRYPLWESLSNLYYSIGNIYENHELIKQ